MSTKPAYPAKVYLNGEILDAGEARISVFDRGFIFGDGIYEVMARIGGRFYYQDAHVDRLRSCLDKVGIRFDLSEMLASIPALLEASGLADRDCLLYLQVTRGVAPRQHAYPAGATPTSLMYAWPKTLPDINGGAASVVLQEDFRWTRCDIKMTSLLGNVMANQFAVENDCYESVFVRDGKVTEASHCNVFFVRDGTLFTHPANNHILDGITRQVVLGLCGKLGVEVREEAVAAADVPDMDEAFLTGTSTQILAIGHWDGKLVFPRAPGPVTRRLQEAFLRSKKSPGA